jgi:hypothetical protein
MDRWFVPRVRRRTEARATVEPESRRSRLVVGSSDDRAEAEADRVAEAVMATLRRPHEVDGDPFSAKKTRIRRSSAVPVAERGPERLPPEVMPDLASATTPEWERAVHRTVAPETLGSEGGPVDVGTESRIRSSRGSGAPLPEPLRRSMEGSLGADLGGVRLHTGPSSDELNRSMQSRAFTVGGDIFFARDQYQPSSDAGRELLAHELTHTIQQGAASRSGFVQRALVDVASVDQKLENASASNTRAMREALPARLALRDYTAFLDTRLRAPQWKPATPSRGRTLALGGHRGNETAGTLGAAFYARAQTLLDALTVALEKLIGAQHAEKADTSWLVALVEDDIPQTLGWAAKVRDNYQAFGGMRALDALRTARRSALTEYVKQESPSDWARMSDAEKQLLFQNSDADHARVAAIRHNAQKMLDANQSPKAILKYMAVGATEFVHKVFLDYKDTMPALMNNIAVVSSGSFGSGELFPYSDLDLQVVKSGLDPQDPNQVNDMQYILHNLRMRVRLANMHEFGGSWTATKGWDWDQLAQDAFNATTATDGRDAGFGLAFARLLVSSGGGASEAAAVQQHFKDNRLDTARTLMVGLWTDKGKWSVANPNLLDEGAEPFDYKLKFMRLAKVYLNVLALAHELHSDNSWNRVDELVKMNVFSKKDGLKFKTYLDLTAKVRMRIQFSYKEEGRDMVTPTAAKQPETDRHKREYPTGFYVLTPADRKMLKEAQAIQNILRERIKETRDNL